MEHFKLNAHLETPLSTHERLPRYLASYKYVLLVRSTTQTVAKANTTENSVLHQEYSCPTGTACSKAQSLHGEHFVDHERKTIVSCSPATGETVQLALEGRCLVN